MGREFELNAEGWDSMYEGSEYILGLNEPYGEVDLKGREKHFSPHHAYDVWAQWEAKKSSIERKIGKPVKLVSHSISGKDSARDWALETFGFFHNISKHFDYIAVHWYRCGVPDMLKGLDKIYSMFKKPMWLTEFNCGSYTLPGNRPATQAEQKAFMLEALPILDMHPHVVRYNWYSDETGNDGYDASLFHGTEMTELGKIYNNYRQGPKPASCTVPRVDDAADDACAEGGATIESGAMCTAQCRLNSMKPSTQRLFCTLGVLDPPTYTCEGGGPRGGKGRLSAA